MTRALDNPVALRLKYIQSKNSKNILPTYRKLKLYKKGNIEGKERRNLGGEGCGEFIFIRNTESY